MKSASPIPTVMYAQCCSSGNGSNDGGGGDGGGGISLATTQCPALQVTSRMLRSPSHESVTTDLSLFSVSSIASDLRSANRLVTFKSYSDAQLTGRGPSPKPDSRQIQGNRFVVLLLQFMTRRYMMTISHWFIIYLLHFVFLGQRTFLRFYGSKKRTNWSAAAVFCRQHWDCARALVRAMCRSFPVRTRLGLVVYERRYPHWPSTLPNATPCWWSTLDSIMPRGPAAPGSPWANPWPVRPSFPVRMEEPRRSSLSNSRSNSSRSNLPQMLNRCHNYHRNHRHRRHHPCPSPERISSGPSIRKSDRTTYDEGW